MNISIIDYRATEEEIYNLKLLGFHPIICPPCHRLYTPVDGHPDMQLTIINETSILVHKDIPESFVNQLQAAGINILYSTNHLNETYPQDIILNCLIIGDIFIHKINSSDPSLLTLFKDKKQINVKQGYTKCSTAVLGKNAAITSDFGIAAVLEKEGIDVLLLPPGDIDLPGVDYGFIGGATGLIDYKRICFLGDLRHYSYGKEIIDFLRKHDLEPVYLRKGKLIDRGTLFCLSI